MKNACLDNSSLVVVIECAEIGNKLESADGPAHAMLCVRKILERIARVSRELDGLLRRKRPACGVSRCSQRWECRVKLLRRQAWNTHGDRFGLRTQNTVNWIHSYEYTLTFWKMSIQWVKRVSSPWRAKRRDEARGEMRRGVRGARGAETRGQQRRASIAEQSRAERRGERERRAECRSARRGKRARGWGYYKLAEK